MNRIERNELLYLAKQRARVAKAAATERQKILQAEAEDLMAAEFEARDALWADAVAIAEEACAKANATIQARCLDLGIPPRDAPGLQLHWRAQGGQYMSSAGREQARKLADKRLAALTASAKAEIDRRLLETETALIAPSLESDDALAALEAMPTAEDLMPSISLADLGVKTWQPPEGAASALLAPSTTADRRRRQVLQHIAGNPTASNRAIAGAMGIDHKTVAKYRAEAGEFPTDGGEFPSDDD